MTKQRTKKATQHSVTTGTFLKVAKFIGVSLEGKTSSESGVDIHHLALGPPIASPNLSVGLQTRC